MSEYTVWRWLILSSWSTDRIIAVGVLVAFVISVSLGGDKELQTFLAGGLVGYLRSHAEGK